MKQALVGKKKKELSIIIWRVQMQRASSVAAWTKINYGISFVLIRYVSSQCQFRQLQLFHFSHSFSAGSRLLNVLQKFSDDEDGMWVFVLILFWSY